MDEPERLRCGRPDSHGERRGRGAPDFGAEGRAGRSQSPAARTRRRVSAATARRSSMRPRGRRSMPARSRPTPRAWRSCGWRRSSTTTTSISPRSRASGARAASSARRCSRTSGARCGATRRLVNLLVDEVFAKAVGERQAAWREMVTTAVQPRHSGAGDGGLAGLLRRLPQRASAGQPHAGPARLLRRAHLPPGGSRRELSHGVDDRAS